MEGGREGEGEGDGGEGQTWGGEENGEFIVSLRQQSDGQSFTFHFVFRSKRQMDEDVINCGLVKGTRDADNGDGR